MDKFTEIKKLAMMLGDAGIPFSFAPIFDGYQIRIYSSALMTEELDDCICHSGSHGWDDGLLETFALNGCNGWETAEQVFEGWKKMFKKAQNGG